MKNEHYPHGAFAAEERPRLPPFEHLGKIRFHHARGMSVKRLKEIYGAQACLAALGEGVPA